MVPRISANVRSGTETERRKSTLPSWTTGTVIRTHRPPGELADEDIRDRDLAGAQQLLLEGVARGGFLVGERGAPWIGGAGHLLTDPQIAQHDRGVEHARRARRDAVEAGEIALLEMHRPGQHRDGVLERDDLAFDGGADLARFRLRILLELAPLRFGRPARDPPGDQERRKHHDRDQQREIGADGRPQAAGLGDVVEKVHDHPASTAEPRCGQGLSSSFNGPDGGREGFSRNPRPNILAALRWVERIARNSAESPSAPSSIAEVSNPSTRREKPDGRHS